MPPPAMASTSSGKAPMSPEAGMPPAKQQQHEEALAPLDDQERRAVQKRLMRRSQGASSSHTTRGGSSSRASYNDLAGMSPKTQGRPGGSSRSGRGAYSSRSAMTTSRSMMTTARSSSPTGRYHPDPTRRIELRRCAHAGANPHAQPRTHARASHAAPPHRLFTRASSYDNNSLPLALSL